MTWLPCSAAVLLCWGLAGSGAAAQELAPVEVTQRRIDAALDAGTAWLVAHRPQRATRQGQHALAIYAALQGGASRDREDFHAFAASLREVEFAHTYDTACVVCMLVALDPERYGATLVRAAGSLADWQRDNGGWGYPSGEDLSNTQYAALGLWRASQIGLRFPDRMWQRLAERVREYQTDDGGFSYQHSGGAASVNMTTAGAGTLAVCEQQLRLADAWSHTDARRVGEARARGLAWLEDRMPSPGTGLRGWPAYGLYGMERLGAWAGVELLGAHDWYRRGAAHLLAQQGEDGSWGGSLVDTSFAVLFLARATAGGARAVAVTHIDAQQGGGSAPLEGLCRLRVDGTGPKVVVDVDRWNWPALRAYEWPQDRGRGPRVAWVEYLLDEQPVAVQLVDASRPVALQDFRTELWMLARGPHTLRARFHLELPERRRGEEALEPVIDSETTDFVALWALTLESDALGMRAFADDAGPDYATVRASSRQVGRRGLPAGRDARDAVDGDLNTAWLARAGDDDAELELRLRRARPLKQITLYPARPQPEGAPLAQPRLVEVRVGQERHAVILSAAGAPYELHLDGLTEVERVVLVVRTVHKPPGGEEAPCGFAEVTLTPAD